MPFVDVLNVRNYPAASSQKQAAYPNGTILQMTGKCTGGVNLLDIGGLWKWRQQQTVLYRWCEIWHDTARDRNVVTGWIYGKYIEPY